jgi:hypothetical protein
LIWALILNICLHTLLFQACEAAFCHSIVPIAVFSTHTALVIDAVGR